MVTKDHVFSRTGPADSPFLLDQLAYMVVVQMNKENILIAADHIENLPEATDFNMACEVHECGSPSCFAGQFAFLQAIEEGTDWKLANKWGDERSNALRTQLAKEWSGLDSDAFSSLCYPDMGSGSDQHPYLINNRQGAKVLRHLAETGEVNFNVLKKD